MLALGRSGAAVAVLVSALPRHSRGSRQLAERTVSGGHGGGETPVPIPNTAVKPARADGTWGEAPWESRSPPGFLIDTIPSELRLEGIRVVLRATFARPGRRKTNGPCDTSTHAGPVCPYGTVTGTGLHGRPTRHRPRLLPMSRRDTEETHRAATPLELLFDLCFVVAVSQTGDQLNDALRAGHYQSGIVGFFMVFFAIWWAWVNFTWFASAYDVDDLAYRLLTFVQIVGVLILAPGVSTAFDHANFAVITIGYVVMRVAMVAQWLRAAAGDPAGRPVALRYAAGISICQVGWVARLFLPHEAGWSPSTCSPFWRCWSRPGPRGRRRLRDTVAPGAHQRALRPLHPHRARRVHRGDHGRHARGRCRARRSSGPSRRVAAGAVLLVFSVWWWYFEHPSEEGLRMSRGTSFFWGYGHYFVFSSIAALGTGLELAAASTHGGEGTVPQSEAGLAIAMPVAVFFVVTAILQAKLDGMERWRIVAVCVTAVVVLGLGWAAAGRTNIGVAALLMGLAVAALVAVDEWRHPKHAPPNAPRRRACPQ